MQLNRNTHLITKILLSGILITGLIYFFHPETEQFSLIINGEPVADPLVRFAAFPTLLAILLFTGILMVLAYFGVGLLIFLGALLFMMFGVFIVAPFFWPILLILFLIIALMSFSHNKTS